MGCINSEGQFDHWFGNIHLSGPCNRSCYFCIGQHMMALDKEINLADWPLESLGEFAQECRQRGITEVNVTGSNTDPLLYQHTEKLREALVNGLGEDLTMGLRTNGVLALDRPHIVDQYDKFSLSVTSLDPDIYKETMGQGEPPNIEAIREQWPSVPIKLNTVLTPHVLDGDLLNTIQRAGEAGISRMNLREPYGQEHIGDPLAGRFGQAGTRLGMPYYEIAGVDVTYWDVHYCKVESVNLYANGEVSTTYPVTEGHDPESGTVQPQSEFEGHTRRREQWQYEPA